MSPGINLSDEPGIPNYSTMKRFILIVVLTVAGVCVIWIVLRLKTKSTNSSSGMVSSRTNGTPNLGIGSNAPVTQNPKPRTFRGLEDRRSMSWDERLKWLEQNGEVPIDADAVDWQLAQQTSWWGKPLNPKEFWKDRVVWLDKSSEDAARRKGRGYPPIPYNDTRFASYENDRDFDNSKMWDVEGANIRFRGTERESVFWTEFIKTKPHPPERLTREQYQIANRMLGSKYRYDQGGNPARANPQRLAQRQQSEIGQAQRLGSPAEALSEDALFWSYVMKQREEYTAHIAPLSGVNQVAFTNWIGGLFVDRKYVTEPLTAEQLTAANAWKAVYLQRLRREKVDESYINAYLQSWNLPREAVFSGTNQP